MIKQPEALRLAQCVDFPSVHLGHETAAELRRLHDLLGKANALNRIRAERIAALEQAGRQALEALKNYKISDDDRVSIAMSILQERLAQPTGKQSLQVEPVAWQWLDTGTFRKSLPASAEPGAWTPLYTTPPQEKNNA